MNTEIERKFIVSNISGLKERAFEVQKIKQAYIGQGENFIQRVRAKEIYASEEDFKMGICKRKKGILTIKEMVGGLERFESEQQWDLSHVYLMIDKEKEKIEKVRYCLPQKEVYSLENLTSEQEKILLLNNARKVNVNGLPSLEIIMVWEIDFFEGLNQGLVLAEMELYFKEQEITIPDFIGKEVSDSIDYFNANLSKKPYTTWK